MVTGRKGHGPASGGRPPRAADPRAFTVTCWAHVVSCSGNIEPAEVEPLITDHTQAIMIVHWGGNPCDIERSCKIGRANGIMVIEDAAHALGAVYQGQPVGQHSDFVAFSFQAITQVTSTDGGCLDCQSA